MLVQNLDKFISGKNKTLYTVGVPDITEDAYTSNLSKRMKGCPIVNIDCMVEVAIQDKPILKSTELEEVVKKIYLDYTNKHKSFITEGCSLLVYNTLSKRDSILVFSNNIDSWLSRLSFYRCHTLSERIKEYFNIRDEYSKFIQGKDLSMIDNTSKMFLQKLL